MASVFEFSDYREFLRHEYETRSTANPRFSLRSMARMLALSPASLSGLILRRKNLSADRASLIARKLKLGGHEKDYFLLQVQLSTSRSELAKQEIKSKLATYKPRKKPRNLTPEKFIPISKWHFMALLEICQRDWIGEEEFPAVSIALRITPKELKSACEAMTAMGLLIADGSRYRRAHSEEVLVRSEYPNPVVRSYHRQVAELSALAIENQESPRRFTSSDFFPISEQTALCMREKMDAFLDELHAMAASSPPGDAVFGLSLNFFHVFDHAKKEVLQ